MGAWSEFWHIWLVLVVVTGVGMAAVCFVGGIVDMVGFVKDLRKDHLERKQ